MRHLSLAVLIFVCTLGIPSEALAQSYGAVLGVRLSNNPTSRSLGLTGKYRLAKTVTLEGILQSDFRDNTTAHLLIANHRRVLTRRLNMYVGTGISIGQETSLLRDPNTRLQYTTYGNQTIGADLIIGAETTLLKYNISIDYKPNINFIGREPWYVGQVGISIREVVIKSNARKKNKRERARKRKKRERSKNSTWPRSWFDR